MSFRLTPPGAGTKTSTVAKLMSACDSKRTSDWSGRGRAESSRFEEILYNRFCPNPHGGSSIQALSACLWRYPKRIQETQTE